MSNTSYQYPPDLLNLLIQAIPRLCRGKQDVLAFFRGAGAQPRHIDDLATTIKRDRGAHTKFDLARTVLTRINEEDDQALAVRREVIKRVVEFEDFTLPWPDDAAAARGYVAQVREMVNAKDTFTRINQERERERDAARTTHRMQVEAVKQQRAELDGIKKDLYALFGFQNPHLRGKALENVLNRLFAAFGVSVREAFTLRVDNAGVVEQVDGVIEFGGHVYLVEMKWWDTPLGVAEIAQHLVRLFGRHEVRGMFISASGYSAPAIEQCRSILSQRVVVLATLEEIVRALEGERSLVTMLSGKAQAAMIDKNPFASVIWS
jgi:restriction system protein